MKKNQLFALWGGLFIICAGLGFIPEPTGAVRSFLTVLSIGFFVPPTLLLHQAGTRRDRRTLALVRNLALASLGMTLLVLAVNMACAMASPSVGNVLHGILVVVSSPMVSSGYWAMSLFLWACLLMVSIRMLRGCKKSAKNR